RLPGLGLPGRHVLGLPASGPGRQAQDPGAQRSEALRDRGPGSAWSPERSRRAGRKGGRTAGRVGMTSRARVMGTLGAVHDPELDEAITALRFVSSCVVSDDGDVEVVLRLPTPQCAPNFAFLMAADARNVVRRLPGVRDVRVTLEDHYTGEEINAALARDEG